MEAVEAVGFGGDGAAPSAVCPDSMDGGISPAPSDPMVTWTSDGSHTHAEQERVTSMVDAPSHEASREKVSHQS